MVPEVGVAGPMSSARCPMVPKSLKNALLLVTVLLVVGSGVLISQFAIHRYSVILLKSSSGRAENIAHELALDAADSVSQRYPKKSYRRPAGILF